MSFAITTGPFRVPQAIIGATNPGASPFLLIVNFKNPTDKEKEVRVIVEECQPPTVPVIPLGERCAVSNQVAEIEICDEVIFLDSHRCRQLFLQIPISTVILRVTVIGDVDEDSKKVEVSVIGTDSLGLNHEPSMFFRHEDFVKAKEK
ncbi:hypothetical protein LIT32_18030 [Bacillus sp. CMF21]|nr:hypothetical protein LIT32_18030 [Bacillus sp. CMF21]